MDLLWWGVATTTDDAAADAFAGRVTPRRVVTGIDAGGTFTDFVAVRDGEGDGPASSGDEESGAG